jgi:hypothetical protein
MKVEGLSTVIWRMVRNVLLTDLVIFVLTALICWLGGWFTLRGYGNGLMIAGVMAFLLGGATGFGGATIARDPTYRYIQSVMSNSLVERTHKDWIDLMDSFSFFIQMGTAGLLSVGLGWLVTLLPA